MQAWILMKLLNVLKITSPVKKTLFIAESLDNLMKNGRISKFKGKLATALNIKPIMAATDEGEIVLKEKARGSNKAFKRLAQLVCENADNTGDRILAISHCNNLSRAKMLKEEIEKHCAFKKSSYPSDRWLIKPIRGQSRHYSNVLG